MTSDMHFPVQHTDSALQAASLHPFSKCDSWRALAGVCHLVSLNEVDDFTSLRFAQQHLPGGEYCLINCPSTLRPPEYADYTYTLKFFTMPLFTTDCKHLCTVLHKHERSSKLAIQRFPICRLFHLEKCVETFSCETLLLYLRVMFTLLL